MAAIALAIWNARAVVPGGRSEVHYKSPEAETIIEDAKKFVEYISQ